MSCMTPNGSMAGGGNLRVRLGVSRIVRDLVEKMQCDRSRTHAVIRNASVGMILFVTRCGRVDKPV